MYESVLTIADHPPNVNDSNKKHLDTFEMFFFLLSFFLLYLTLES